MKKDLTSIGPDEMTAIENLAYLYAQRVKRGDLDGLPKGLYEAGAFQTKINNRLLKSLIASGNEVH